MNETEMIQWVTLAQAGDREAFGRLAEQFEQTVFATVLPPVAEPRGSGGSHAGRFHPGDAEAAAIAGAGPVCGLAQADRRADVDQPGRPPPQ